MRMKWTLGLVALLMMSLTIAAAGETQKIKCPGRVQVFTEPVAPQSFTEYQDFAIALAPCGVTPVVAGQSGVVAEVGVAVGQEVQAGQMVFRLELPADLSEAIGQIKISMETLNGQLLKAKKAKQTKRQAALQKKFDAAMARLKEKTRAAEAYTVTTPGNGQVAAVVVEKGAQVAAGDTLLRLTDSSKLKVAVQVPTIADFQEGQAVPLTVDGAALQGVTHIAGETLEVVVANAEFRLAAGATARFRLPLKLHQNAPVLPQERILRDDQGEFVYLAVQNRAVRSPLTIRARENGLCLVDKGLAAGDLLILTGYPCLAEGKKIKILPKEKLLAMEEKKARKEAEKARKIEAKKNRPLPAETRTRETEVAPAATIAESGKFSRIRVGANFSYYSMLDESFSGLYGKMNGFGLDVTYRFTEKIDVWVAFGTASKKATQDWAGTDEFKFSMTPIVADVRYRFLRKEKFDLLAGIGATVYRIKDVNPLETIEATMVGFNLMGGIEYRFGRKLSGEALLRFNQAQKNIRPEADNPLKLGSLELTLGLGYSF